MLVNDVLLNGGMPETPFGGVKQSGIGWRHGGVVGVRVHAERTELLKIAIAAAKGRIQIVAATGTQNHADTVAMTMAAEKAGADAVLVNTAIAVASDASRMAVAFKLAVEAGRAAFEIGLASQQATASATSPLTGFLN